MSLYGEYEDDNIFNNILTGKASSVNVYEDDGVLAFMDIFPESKGHTLVIPKSKVRNFLEMPKEEVGSYMERVHVIANAVNDAFEPDGLKVMQYNGALATQTVFHLHFHIVPCYEGIPLKEHSNEIAQMEELKVYAEKIREHITGRGESRCKTYQSS